MIKKNLIGLVLFTIFSVPAMAAIEQEQADWGGEAGGVVRLKATDWPVDFKWVDTKLIVPVTMNVGLFIEFKNKKEVVDTGIKLKQIGIREFEGCSIPIEIQSNFDFQMAGKLVRTDAGNALQNDCKKWTIEVRDECCRYKKDIVNKTLSTTVEKRKIYVKVVEAKVYELDFGNNVKVADVIVQVKPVFEYEWNLDCDP